MLSDARSSTQTRAEKMRGQKEEAVEVSLLGIILGKQFALCGSTFRLLILLSATCRLAGIERPSCISCSMRSLQTKKTQLTFTTIATVLCVHCSAIAGISIFFLIIQLFATCDQTPLLAPPH